MFHLETELKISSDQRKQSGKTAVKAHISLEGGEWKRTQHRNTGMAKLRSQRERSKKTREKYGGSNLLGEDQRNRLATQTTHAKKHRGLSSYAENTPNLAPRPIG